MGNVISVIVFVAILVSVLGKASKKSVPVKKPGQPGNRQMPGSQHMSGSQHMQGNQQMQRNQQMQGNQHMQGNQQMAGNQHMPGSQHMTGNGQAAEQRSRQPVQSKPAYGAQTYQKPVSKNDILDRATAHVKQQEKSTYQRQEPEESLLMKKIEDLMIKGYDSGLTFERDFVGEGMKLLNRMQM